VAGRNAASWKKDDFMNRCFDLWDEKMVEWEAAREKKEVKEEGKERVTTRSSKKRKSVCIDLN
jgi:hypothetical protein